jgi:hypothetical protein
METEVPDKIVEKLKKLMRLQEGAKKIGSEGEANAAAAAISRLLTQYNLSLMDIDPEERKETMQIQRTGHISFKDTYGLWKRSLMNVLCEFNYCKTFLISGQTNMIVVGTEANTSTVIYLYDMLRSIFRKLAPVRYEEFAKGKRGAARTEKYKRKYIASYLNGCAYGLKAKLKLEAAANEVQEKSLVVCHNQLINDYMSNYSPVERKAPKTKKKDIAEAFCNGYRDGKNTNINKAIDK